MKAIFERIEGRIGYNFRNKENLETALTHSSFSNEHKGVECYERMEFLGDAVVEFVITQFLLETFPQANEGELSKIRAGIVNRYTLSNAIEYLKLLPYIRTGMGNARLDVINSTKIRSDIFEAIVGAIIIDSESMEPVKTFILNHLSASAYKPDADYKSRLLECCARLKKRARFAVADEKIEGRFFKVKLFVGNVLVSEGIGTTIKTAEQEASRIYLNHISK